MSQKWLDGVALFDFLVRRREKALCPVCALQVCLNWSGGHFWRPVAAKPHKHEVYGLCSGESQTVIFVRWQAVHRPTCSLDWKSKDLPWHRPSLMPVPESVNRKKKKKEIKVSVLK